MTQFQVGTFNNYVENCQIENGNCRHKLFRNQTKGVWKRIRMRKNKCNDFTVLANENRSSSTGPYYTNNSTNTIVHNHDKTRWMSSFAEIRSLFLEKMFHNQVVE